MNGDATTYLAMPLDPIPEGREDDMFQNALRGRGLVLRGSVSADRDYARLICEHFDDGQGLADLVEDVRVGTDLPPEQVGYVIGAAVRCYAPHHLPTVLPPGVVTVSG